MKVVVLANSPDALVEVCGISMIERMLRTLQRLEIFAVSIVGASEEIRGALSRPSWPREKVKIEFVDRLPNDALALLVPGDIYCETRLLVALLLESKPAILIDSNPSEEMRPLLAKAKRNEQGFVCGPALLGDNSATLDAAALDPYVDSLRRELHPLWFPAPEAAQIPLAERLIFDTTQKGILDVTARLHWPFENFLVRQLWRTRITPNQVTLFATLLGCVITIEFARGDWWTATLLSRVFAILDGVDGKLARAKVETSELGALEAHIDTVLEYSWWLALAYSLGVAGLAHAWLYTALIIVGDLLGKLANRVVAAHTGKPSHRLGNFERYFRLVGGRRDIYTAMLLIGLFVRQPGLAFAAAGCWSMISLAVQSVRTVFIRFGTLRQVAHPLR